MAGGCELFIFTEQALLSFGVELLGNRIFCKMIYALSSPVFAATLLY